MGIFRSAHTLSSVADIHVHSDRLTQTVTCFVRVANSHVHLIPHFPTWDLTSTGDSYCNCSPSPNFLPDDATGTWIPATSIYVPQSVAAGKDHEDFAYSWAISLSDKWIFIQGDQLCIDFWPIIHHGCQWLLIYGSWIPISFTKCSLAAAGLYSVCLQQVLLSDHHISWLGFSLVMDGNMAFRWAP